MSGTSGAIAFVGGTLIAGNGGAPVPDATVVVEGDRVLATGPSRSVAVAGDARLVDVRGKTVMPGLIDSCLITERGMRILADSGTFIAPSLYPARSCSS